MKFDEFVIKCPKCGYSYLPGEIYLPEHFLGQPKKIEKEGATGKIMYYEGTPQDPEEVYVCDKCRTPFLVTTFMSFDTEVLDEAVARKKRTTKLTQIALFNDEEE